MPPGFHHLRLYVFRRARGSWVDLADGDKKPRNLPKDSPVEGVFRARKQASPRAWGGYDEFANTVELMILVLSTVMGAAFFGLGFVIGVESWLSPGASLLMWWLQIEV